jgi:hypothetical protein
MARRILSDRRLPERARIVVLARIALPADRPACAGCLAVVRHANPWSIVMSDILTPLTIDFLAWLAAEPRDYGEVMDAWRTSCPRLTVWEDAIDAGLITRVHAAGRPIRIELTPRGEALLASRPI